MSDKFALFNYLLFVTFYFTHAFSLLVNSVDSTSSGKESTGNTAVHLSQKSPTSSPTSVSGTVNSNTTVSASAVSSTGISQNLRSNSYIEASKKANNSIDKVVNNTKVNSVHHNDSHTVTQSSNVPAQVASVNQKGPAKVRFLCILLI